MDEYDFLFDSIEVDQEKVVSKEDVHISEIVEGDKTHLIKTVDDAVWYLCKTNLCPLLLKEASRQLPGSYGETYYNYAIVVAALTNNESLDMTSGNLYYPVVQFCREKDIGNCWGKHLIGHIKTCKGETFAVVGGGAVTGSYSGLGDFDSSYGVSGAFSHVGFRSVSSRKVAEYISKRFGKLVFEIMYKRTNCSWEWT